MESEPALIFCFDAFSSREPVHTSLENALGDPSGQYEIAGRHRKPVLVARLSVHPNAQCACALETAEVFRAADGSVGSAVAPALSTTAVVIMLNPSRSTFVRAELHEEQGGRANHSDHHPYPSFLVNSS
jgi:hypothetical protein